LVSKLRVINSDTCASLEKVEKIVERKVWLRGELVELVKIGMGVKAFEGEGILL